MTISFPIYFPPASNSATRRENQICFQTNQIIYLTPADPASSFTMPTTSNQSTHGTLVFPHCSFSTSLPALESLPDKSHGGGLTCGSKLWINSLCSDHLGGLRLLPHARKLNAGMFVASVSRSLGFVNKIVIYFHNFKADGKWELGRVEIGMHTF